MDSFENTITFWATVLGTLVAFFGVFQSEAWMVAIGAVVTSASIAALFYARTQRARVRSAAVTIAGKSIDSLNLANLRRRMNRSLVIQEADILAVIDGENLDLTAKYTGYCRTDRETTIEFSIDADANIPFERLDCLAFDLRHDPDAEHPIRPALVGPDGISKKIAVPFLAPVSTDEPFSVLLKCRLPGCMAAGIDYYAATLSFCAGDGSAMVGASQVPGRRSRMGSRVRIRVRRTCHASPRPAPATCHVRSLRIPG